MGNPKFLYPNASPLPTSPKPKYMPTLRASNLTLEEVSHLLNFEEQIEDVSFSNFLSLESVTEVEKQEIVQISNDFRPYLRGSESHL